MSRRLGLGILLVTRDLDPSGASRYAVTLGRAVAGKGPSVLLLSGKPPPKEIPNSPGFEVRTAPEIFKPVIGRYHIKRFAADLSPGFKVVHAVNVHSLPAAGALSEIMDAASVLTVHSFEEAAEAGETGVQVNRVIAVSEAVRAYLVNDAGLPKEVISTVPDGVDLDSFKPAPVMEETKLRPVIGWMGRLTPVKAPLDFIKAAAVIRRHRPDTEFLVTGRGPLREAVRNLCADLGLRDHTTFVFENMEPEVVLPVMDIFVSTSHSEGLGLAAMEAMACAKPVVATAQGGHFDVVADGHSGYLFPPGDVESCAEAVLKLLNSPASAREMGLNGREIVAEKFDAASVAALLIEVYEEAIASLGRAR